MATAHKQALRFGTHQTATCAPEPQASDVDRMRQVRTARTTTSQVRRREGDALASVLDGRPWSRRRLASAVGVNERIARLWCAGERPIPDERLKASCPVVWNRWRAALDAGERS